MDTTVTDSQDTDECPYCWGDGTVTRLYRTTGPGSAEVLKEWECPICSGAGTVPADSRVFELRTDA